MEPDNQAKRHADIANAIVQRMESALAKCTQLMERHLASGEKTVPARALYFILRDAGYGTTHTQKQEIQVQKQEVQQTQKRIDQPTNQLHHNYGMRR